MRKLEFYWPDSHCFLGVASRFATESGTLCCYSGGNLDSARHSLLFLYPKQEVRVGRDDDDPLAQLKQGLEMGEFAYGYLAYEMGASVEAEKPLALGFSDVPDAQFFVPRLVLKLDHALNRASVFVHSDFEDSDLSLPEGWLKEVSTVQGDFSASSPEFQDFKIYEQNIHKIQEWIRQGEIYQLNYSQSVTVDFSGDAFAFYRALCHQNPAPFSAFFNLGQRQIISTSPERLLSKRGPYLETRPIKGTLPRGKTPEEDRENRECLLNCEKNRAELLMITDLMRNDLGRVSEVGSVDTQELLRCEAYDNVFHLLSRIRSKALTELHPVDIWKAVFPGGSITGCPKLRCMELIREVEQRDRGLYTGSIGYLDPNGDFDLNIAIRTLVLGNGQLECSLGGAITIDSDPWDEYQETLHKGKSIFTVLGKDIGV